MTLTLLVASSSTFLVTVSGPDRVGVGAELFAALTALESRGIVITDVAQIDDPRRLGVVCRK